MLLLVPAELVNDGGPAEAAGDPVIAAAGDIACDPADPDFNGGSGQNDDCMQAATAGLLSQINPVAVLPLGDNQYYCGGYNAFVQSYNLSWGQFLSKTYPTVGNHEFLTSGGTDCQANASGYYGYYSNAAGVGSADELYYSYDIGAWHLIALNSNCSNVGGCSASSPQGKWLADDLAAHPALCSLAYWHIPLWSSGGRSSPNMQSITQQLYDAGVDVVLTGHDHVYERFYPQNPQGQADFARGIRSFVVGTGGANHTSFVTTMPNSEVRNSSAYGVLKMTLHDSSYDWRYAPVAGQSFTDSGSQGCHDSNGRQPRLTVRAWTPLGGVLKNSAAIVSPGAAGVSAVFVRGSDDAVYGGTYNGQWYGWGPLGGTTIAAPAASTRGAGRADLFVTGTDKAVWWRSYNGGWSGWTSLGGVTADGPASASWDDNRTDLFARGLDNQLWHRFSIGDAWSQWEALGGVLTTAPAVASTAAGNLDVAVRGTDGAAWVRSYTASGWSAWASVGGVLVGQPALAARPGQLAMFVVGTDAQMWGTVRDQYVWLGAFEPLGGTHATGPAAALATAPDVFVIAAHGSDDQVWLNEAR